MLTGWCPAALGLPPPLSQNLLGVFPGKEWLALTQAQLKKEKKNKKEKN